MGKSSRSKKDNDHSSTPDEEFSDGSASAFEGTEMTADERDNNEPGKENQKPVSPKNNDTEKKDKTSFY